MKKIPTFNHRGATNIACIIYLAIVSADAEEAEGDDEEEDKLAGEGTDEEEAGKYSREQLLSPGCICSSRITKNSVLS